jgi:hypothetical protein
MVAKNALATEKPRQHDFASRCVRLAPNQQIVGNDPKKRSKLEYIPPFTP